MILKTLTATAGKISAALLFGSAGAKAKVVVSETAPDAVFRLEPEVAEQVFPLIAGVSMGTVFKDVAVAWEIVKPMLLPDAKKALGEMLKASVRGVA